MNVLEVIKKLRTLADPERNDNAPQREAARRKAEELMAKHGITEQNLAGIEYNFSDMEPLLRTIFERMALNIKDHMPNLDEIIKQQAKARAGQAKKQGESARRNQAVNEALHRWWFE